MFYAFLMLWLCVVLAVLFLLTRFAGLDSHSYVVDWGLFALLLVAAAIYSHQAIAVVYDIRGARRMLSAFVLTLTVGMGILGYRFVIFLLTWYRL